MSESAATEIRTVGLERKVKIQESLTVRLIPLNENHELCYQEKFTGTPEEIVTRAKNVIEGLQNLLPAGTFTVKIENFQLSAAIFVTPDGIFDEDFKSLNLF